jgi:hypothetical protein
VSAEEDERRRIAAEMMRIASDFGTPPRPKVPDFGDMWSGFPHTPQTKSSVQPRVSVACEDGYRVVRSWEVADLERGGVWTRVATVKLDGDVVGVVFRR